MLAARFARQRRVGVPKGTFLKPGDRIDATIEGIGTLKVEIKPPA